MKPPAGDDSKPKPFPLSPKQQIEMQLAALGARPGKKKRTLMSAADVVKRSDTLNDGGGDDAPHGQVARCLPGNTQQPG